MVALSPRARVNSEPGTGMSRIRLYGCDSDTAVTVAHRESSCRAWKQPATPHLLSSRSSSALRGNGLDGHLAI